jgi:GWxTD domain-containing protein
MFRRFQQNCLSQHAIVYCCIVMLAMSQAPRPVKAAVSLDIQDAMALIADEQYQRARTLLKAVVAAEPDNAEGLLLLGGTQHRLGNPYEASYRYLAGLEQLEAGQFLTEILPHMRLILTTEEQTYLDGLQPDVQGAFLADYWRAKDPTPATIEHENLLEHLRRIQYAGEHYFGLVPGVYDDRGQYYIKYGIPDTRITTPGIDATPDVTSWGYSSIDSDLSFDFQETDQGAWLVEDLPTVLGIDQSAIADFFEKRQYITPNYLGVVLRSWQKSSEKFLNRQMDARQQAPPYRYYEIWEKPPLRFSQTVSSFRDSDNLSRLEIYYGIPYRSLRFKTSPLGSMKSPIRLEINILDDKRRPIERFTETVIIWAKPEDIDRSRYYFGQASLIVPPGDYELAVTVSSLDQHQNSHQFQSIHVPDYTRKGLQISNVEWAFRVDSTRSEATVQKGDLSVYPLPFAKLDRRLPLHAYFEIYGLEQSSSGDYNALVSYVLAKGEAKEDVELEDIDDLEEFGDLTVQSDDPVTRSWFPLEIKNISQGIATLYYRVTDLATGMSEQHHTTVEFLQPNQSAQNSRREDPPARNLNRPRRRR